MMIFLSNFVSPHVMPLCDELYRQSGGQFKFIETRRISQERQNLGYAQLRNRDYVVAFDDYSDNKTKYQREINDADVVMASFGSIDNELLLDRAKNNRLTFLLSERIFKKGVFKLADPRFWKNLLFFSKIRHKNFHLLCMGAYVAKDFAWCGFPKDRMWKFGYITQEQNVKTSHLDKCKVDKTVRLLWVGRMIWWKRPLQVIKAAKMLHGRGYDFTLDIVGGGKLEHKVRSCLAKANLPEVACHGLKKNDEVREMMLASHVLVCTSNRLEGWGAVINEGMNAGCIVVASEQMGATPYLIKDGKTGYSYSGGAKELYQALTKTFKRSRIDIAENARAYIHNHWGADVAAQRLLNLIAQIGQGKPNPGSESGICSRA